MPNCRWCGDSFGHRPECPELEVNTLCAYVADIKGKIEILKEVEYGKGLKDGANLERERIINFLITSTDFHLCQDKHICSNGTIRRILNP